MEEKLIQNTDISLGKLLQKKREELSLDVKKISSQLNIKIKYIAAIEAEDWQNLDKNLYVAGLILSYAKLLKLDENLINEKIRTLPIESNVNKKKHQLVNIGENLDLTPDKDVFFNFLIASLLLFFILLTVMSSKEDKTDLVTNSFVIEKMQQLKTDDANANQTKIEDITQEDKPDVQPDVQEDINQPQTNETGI